MGHPKVERVTWMKSARTGYSKSLMIFLAYHMHYDPCSMLLVQPTVDDAKGFSKDEIAPMLRDVPVLRHLVSESGRRDSKNTLIKKSFPGGHLTMVGANSAGGFRRITVRAVLFDETSAYPLSAGQEGDQIQLGIKRTETAWNRKIIDGSTPTTENDRIHKAYQASDSGCFLVPCPECTHYHELEFKNLHWPDGAPEKAQFVCPECGSFIDHKHKRKMVENGYWKGETWEYRNGEFTFSDDFSGHIGFRLWAAYSYSPNSSWGRLSKEFVGVKDDPEKLKTYVNTVMGEVWREMEGDGIEYEYLYASREEYDTETLSPDIKIITAGVDVQGIPGSATGRLEMEIIGWGAGEESWTLDHLLIEGDPGRPDVWAALDEQLARKWTDTNGKEISIHRTCIDSGGGFTQVVYDYCRQRQDKIFAVKGQSQANKPIIGKPTIIKGVKVYPVGSDTAKDILYSRFAKSASGSDKMCHFHFGLSADYFKQLVAERVVKRHKAGVEVRQWVCPSGTRNEVLDCWVYSLAALRVSNVNLKEGAPRHKAVVKQQTVSENISRAKPRQRRRGGFIRR